MRIDGIDSTADCMPLAAESFAMAASVPLREAALRAHQRPAALPELSVLLATLPMPVRETAQAAFGALFVRLRGEPTANI